MDSSSPCSLLILLSRMGDDPIMHWLQTVLKPYLTHTAHRPHLHSCLLTAIAASDAYRTTNHYSMGPEFEQAGAVRQYHPIVYLSICCLGRTQLT